MLRALPFGVGTAVLAVACYWSLRLAYADHLSRSNSLQARVRAVQLAPQSAELYTRMADLMQRMGRDESSALKSATDLNPNNAWALMQLGLRYEMSADFCRAERNLLQAADVDKQFQPRWTLANYYFRRGDADRCWFWTKQALAMTNGDPKPLFQLCWRLTDDPGVILNRVIPDRRPVLTQYLSFLISENRLSAANIVYQKVIADVTVADVPTLLAYCDRLLDAGLQPLALDVWNSLAQRKLIPYDHLDPDAGISLTNGSFNYEPRVVGFDWHLPQTGGVFVLWVPQSPRLEISFSGKQPNNCEILSQLMPLMPEKTYLLRFEYRSSVRNPDAGLRWRIFDTTSGLELPSSSPKLSNQNWTEATATFSSTRDVRLARLILWYGRSPGITRIEGTLGLRNLTLGIAQ